MNKKKLLILFNIALALAIILYTFYIRVIIVRLPKSLYIIQNTVINYSLLILVLVGLSYSIFMLITNVISTSKNSTSILAKISFELNNVIDNAMSDFYIMITNCIPNVYEKIAFIAQKFYALFHNAIEAIFLFILFFIRSLIVIAFLIDVFIFFKLDYMYKALYLLCASILIKVLFYILRDFATNLSELESYFIITDKGIDSKTNLPKTSYQLKHEFKMLDLGFYTGQYILCSKLSGYLEMYERYSNFFTPYFNIIIYSCYFAGWIYILFTNFIT